MVVDGLLFPLGGAHKDGRVYDELREELPGLAVVVVVVGVPPRSPCAGTVCSEGRRDDTGPNAGGKRGEPTCKGELDLFADDVDATVGETIGAAVAPA